MESDTVSYILLETGLGCCFGGKVYSRRQSMTKHLVECYYIFTLVAFLDSMTNYYFTNMVKFSS